MHRLVAEIVALGLAAQLCQPANMRLSVSLIGEHDAACRKRDQTSSDIVEKEKVGPREAEEQSCQGRVEIETRLGLLAAFNESG